MAVSGGSIPWTCPFCTPNVKVSAGRIAICVAPSGLVSVLWRLMGRILLARSQVTLSEAFQPLGRR